jgi:hypothetical protein
MVNATLTSTPANASSYSAQVVVAATARSGRHASLTTISS